MLARAQLRRDRLCAELIDKGLYSASVVYRDGNIVSLGRWFALAVCRGNSSRGLGSYRCEYQLVADDECGAVGSHCGQTPSGSRRCLAAADAAQADADTALTTLTNIVSR